MKNFFCVGQKVIVLCTRKTATVEVVGKNGLLLDNNQSVFLDEVQPLEEYLDPTNFFYHHSRFGKGQEMANDGFSSLMFVLEERDELTQFEKESGHSRPKFHAFLDGKQQEAESMIETGLMIQRTAEHNLNQWSSGDVIHVIEQHMPFLNPEDCPEKLLLF